jgi:hypothetical protein
MRYTTKTACKILGRDRKQQADDIATGYCGHVPAASAGLRYWDHLDLAAELYFMELRRDAYSVRVAGAIATRLRLGMHAYPEADQLTLVRCENGNAFALPTDTLDLSTGWNSGAPVREALTIEVRNLKERVSRRIEAHDEAA